jgi:hypothetical protein
VGGGRRRVADGRERRWRPTILGFGLGFGDLWLEKIPWPPDLEGWWGRQPDRRWGWCVGGTAGGGDAYRWPSCRHDTGTTWLDTMGHGHDEAQWPAVPCLIVPSCRWVVPCLIVQLENLGRAGKRVRAGRGRTTWQVRSPVAMGGSGGRWQWGWCGDGI